MKIENTIAFSFIMPDELYLLNKDKTPVVAYKDPPPVTETQPDDFNFMGGNKKNFLIIVHYPELEFIDDKHLTALESILKRLNFSVDDTAIFNIAKYTGTTIKQLADYFEPQRLLLLGKQALPVDTGPIVLNKIYRSNNYPALFSFSFDEMMDSTENKKAFWEQMKQL